MTSIEPDATTPIGPILFAYDGSELAALAIKQAGLQLAKGREALVVCAWQPADVGFEPVNGHHFDADAAPEVHKCAEETAAYGATLANDAGFNARSITIEASPSWKGIIKAAEEHKASLIVIGSHRHTGIVGHLAGSVAAAVVAHWPSAVLIVHPRQ